MTTTAATSAGAHLWSRTDLTPADVDVAQLYDGFTVLTLFWLEGLQFAAEVRVARSWRAASASA